MSQYSASQVLQVLLWETPLLLVGIVMIVVALVRRDTGRWWQLLAGAGALLVLTQLYGVFRTLAFTAIYESGMPYWLLNIPSIIMSVLTFALLVGAAVVDRPRQTGTLSDPTYRR